MFKIFAKTLKLGPFLSQFQYTKRSQFLFFASISKTKRRTQILTQTLPRRGRLSQDDNNNKKRNFKFFLQILFFHLLTSNWWKNYPCIVFKILAKIWSQFQYTKRSQFLFFASISKTKRRTQILTQTLPRRGRLPQDDNNNKKRNFKFFLQMPFFHLLTSNWWKDYPCIVFKILAKIWSQFQYTKRSQFLFFACISKTKRRTQILTQTLPRRGRLPQDDNNNKKRNLKIFLANTIFSFVDIKLMERLPLRCVQDFSKNF